MASTKYSNANFANLRNAEGWISVFEGDFNSFSNKVNQLGSYVNAQAQAIYPEIEKKIGSANRDPGTYTICFYLDQKKSRYVVSLAIKLDDFTLVWSCWQSEEARREHEIDADGAACLKRLAVLALGNRTGIRLPLPEQEDKAFMWKAPSFHPLQVLENVYQRVVRKAGRESDVDPIKAQSETLARFFIQDPGEPECFKSRPLDQFDGNHLAAVRMNHLIETFYLFRLLVHYRVESDAEISEEVRVEVSGDLTKLLHNGDRAKMKWLTDWLTVKIAELGKKINALNAGGNERVIFFLKGGRALNYFLETPEKGENDWDTQVVINPSLPAEDWYKCFEEVHDVLLVALKTFKTEFTELVQQNSGQFAEYLKGASPQGEDEEVDENEEGDINSLAEHANCKAELIDVGIPRRDSPSALEEWTHLGPAKARLESNGVVFPHREYYLNEYVMMVRDAFLPNAEVRKAPKRITRLGLILKNDRGREKGQSADVKKRLSALPTTAGTIEGMEDKGKQELFGIIISQFVEAYNLHQDKELAVHFDQECVARISNPPKLPAGLGELLDDAQKTTASIVGVAHDLSIMMDKHWASRNQFFEEQLQFFGDFVRNLSAQTNGGLEKVRAQFAVAGSFASRIHADHLRLKPAGLEPMRRILVKLQCRKGSNPADVMGAVRENITGFAKGSQKLTVTEVAEGSKQSLLLYWSEKVSIGDFTYAPLVMKVRVAEQSGDQLPVLSSINGIPVLDPRYLVADYLKKTSKIDERGARRVLASATAAVSEMLSKFDFDSDDAG